MLNVLKQVLKSVEFYVCVKHWNAGRVIHVVNAAIVHFAMWQ